jgi:hypothetical protein
MKTKLLKTEKGHYVLIDDTKGTYDNGFLIGSSRRDTDANKLSIKNCESIERGYDLDELAMGYDLYEKINFVGQMRAYKVGFQKSIELNKNKLFTLEDMMNCWNKALKFQDHKETLGEYITSLQQTEWDVEIVEECLDPTCDGVNRKGECITTGKPKLDSDGCLMLKKI